MASPNINIATLLKPLGPSFTIPHFSSPIGLMRSLQLLTLSIAYRPITPKTNLHTSFSITVIPTTPCFEPLVVDAILIILLLIPPNFPPLHHHVSSWATRPLTRATIVSIPPPLLILSPGMSNLRRHPFRAFLLLAVLPPPTKQTLQPSLTNSPNNYHLHDPQNRQPSSRSAAAPPSLLTRAPTPPPLPQPPPPRLYPMQTRSQSGITKPLHMLNLLASTITSSDNLIFKQASKHAHWHHAMESEISALQAQAT